VPRVGHIYFFSVFGLARLGAVKRAKARVRSESEIVWREKGGGRDRESCALPN
jgi:hypothetical protein